MSGHYSLPPLIPVLAYAIRLKSESRVRVELWFFVLALFYSTTLYSEMSQIEDNISGWSSRRRNLPFLNHCIKIKKKVVKGAKRGRKYSTLEWTREWILSIEKSFQSSFLFYKGTAYTASSTQNASDENVDDENQIKLFLLKTNWRESAILFSVIYHQSMIVILVCLYYAGLAILEIKYF